MIIFHFLFGTAGIGQARRRLAAHARTPGNRQHSTHRDHMPAHHRFKANWTPERIRRQAARIGPRTEAYVEVIMRERRHPEQGYRSCMGILRLAKIFGRDRLEAACKRAIDINARSYGWLDVAGIGGRMLRNAQHSLTELFQPSLLDWHRVLRALLQNRKAM